MDEPLGFIPEVNETYAMWESVYGLMNEHGLTIGESSTYARINGPGVDLENPSTHEKGPALFSIAMLIQIALERCKTAVCAVRTMGRISEEYGFYAETFNAGESLSIVDTTGDGWIFHILPDPTGKSSIWCARRVPQGHVAALANQFTISTIDKDDMYSEHMYEIAKEQGLWDGESIFEFNKVFGTPGILPMYISVRLWYIYQSVAPSLNLSPKVDPFDFPFSVPVDRRVTVEDIMSIYRSRYEGTEFDMTRGILAGPFGNPQRVDGGDGITQVGGQVTRPIAIQRTAYAMIGIADPDRPLIYYATDTPTTSVYVPFLASTLKQANAHDMNSTRSLYSDRYQVGSRKFFDRYSAWWAFDFVANWMNINYQNMSTTYVYPAVEKWQKEMIKLGESGDQPAIHSAVDEMIDSWWTLADLLVVRYNDGYYNYPESSPEKIFYTGYPAEYLRQIRFDDRFVYPINACGDEITNGLVSKDEVKKTVHELHYLRDVILPSKYNRTIIVNVSEPNGLTGHVTSAIAPTSYSFFEVIKSLSILVLGMAGGYWIALSKKSHNVSSDVYTRIA
jgi:dipeptidase